MSSLKTLEYMFDSLINLFEGKNINQKMRLEGLKLRPQEIDVPSYPMGPRFWLFSPTIVSFSFPVSLFVAQFTIFGSFRILNFQSHFEALNNIFSTSNGRENMSLFWTQYLSFMDVVLKQIFLTMYHARQTEVVC